MAVGKITSYLPCVIIFLFIFLHTQQYPWDLKQEVTKKQMMTFERDAVIEDAKEGKSGDINEDNM